MSSDTLTETAAPIHSEPPPVSQATQRQGFRLTRFEVLNWGTFDRQIWHLDNSGDNCLLTGNIGSGKSTLVDGLTTLLVPPRKLAFNKAAGAENKERSLESYFYGYYTSQQDESGKARAVGLRSKGNHYSVLLAQFHSVALQQTITLAQIFWLKPGENKVKRLFVVVPEALDIATHFSDFGTQIKALRKRLQKMPELTLVESFNQYQQTFSKWLGLGTDGKALELFNQTISMKSVGSVTDFVRQNMLEQPDVEGQIQELERNYESLKRLHDAVVAAREKITLLQPIDKHGRQAQEAAQEKQHFSFCRDYVDSFMAEKAVVLYEKRIVRQQGELEKLAIDEQQLQSQKRRLNQTVSQLRSDIDQNGGGRLQQLQEQIKTLEEARNQSKRLCDNYLALVKQLGLPEALTADNFVSNIRESHSLFEQHQQQLENIESRQDDYKLQYYQLQQQQQAVKQELEALRHRKSNIPVRQLNIRERLCEYLKVEESRLPFVGELVQVKQSQTQWQGAIERVLHNFALSLVVPDSLYADVSDFVENTHLGTRLVYYRVKSTENYYPQSPQPDSLLAKIEIKRDSEHFQWLHRELQQRFDYQCCESMTDFRRSEKAISLQGQVKSGRFRHEKDDRHSLHDKSRFVLGWSNQAKLDLLAAQIRALQTDAAAMATTLAQCASQRRDIEELRRQAKNLSDFNLTFEQINWSQFANQLEVARQEIRVLEQSSDVLRELQQQFQHAQTELTQVEEAFRAHYQQLGKLETKLEDDHKILAEKTAECNAVSEQVKQRCYPDLSALYEKHGAAQIRIDMLANQCSVLRTKLNEKIQHLEEKRSKREKQMLTAMKDFAFRFPNDVTELDVSEQSLSEYQQMLKTLQDEDLPRHETRFKEMLNQDTIRSMALFRSYLDKQEEQIDARVSMINRSLRELDYQQGTYIEIDSISSPDLDIREFKQRLKSCVEFSTDDNLYSEHKFEQVKALIEQMRHEPTWTQKVVDVRYWQLFNVVERYREDNSEKECYSDSGGKSGGQKEKLAYSILAAAILLQYRLVDDETGAKAKRRFNLVVIDEAFARGSKDSTRFGLELFKKLGLQLLLVTPLQKLDVIEHYVQQVHFVDQRSNRSMVLNMTIKEYRERLAQHKSQQQYKALVEEVEQNPALKRE